MKRLLLSSIVIVVGCRGVARDCVEPTRARLRTASAFDVALPRRAPATAHVELEALPTCGTLDGIGVGDSVALTTTTFGGTEGQCVLGATIDAPVIVNVGGGRSTGPPASDVELWVVQRSDFGGGCTGLWDFAIVSATEGGTLAIRRFVADDPAACEPALGSATGVCGDYFFATVTARE